MNFSDINWMDCDQEAYINCKCLYNNNIETFLNTLGRDNPKTSFILFQIYKMFCYMEDKGKSYPNFKYDNGRFILFKDNEYNLPGCIYITTYGNFIQIDCEFDKFTGYRNFIRLTITPNNSYITGYLKEKDKPAITINGNDERDKEFVLNVTAPNKRYIIQGDEAWHIFATLSSSILNKNYFKTIKDKGELLNRLISTLNEKGLFNYQEDLIKLVRELLKEDVGLEYYEIDISNFFVAKSLENYLDNIKYEDKIDVKKEDIKGLDVGIDAIKKFSEYQVIDEFNGAIKRLIDIPLYLKDTIDESKCEFLDELIKVKEEDIDVYIVGLAYFATYCSDFGRLSGRNFYGANIYPRYSGYKNNVVIKSSLLGIPLSDYAIARCNDSYDNCPQVTTLFKMLGFNMDDRYTYSRIDTSEFKKLLPYIPVVTNKRRNFW